MNHIKFFHSFLLCVLCGVTCAQEFIRQFHFVNKSLNWTEAQQFCREHYSDLATVSNLEEVNKLQRPDSYSGDAWIGLFRSKAVGYQNWGSGSLDNLCTGLDYSGLWYDHGCSHSHYYVCYRNDDSQGKTFHLKTVLRTYAEAQAYCRMYYTDLALIESEEENHWVGSLLNQYDYAWILKPWLWAWSDGSSSMFTNWASDRPLEVEQYSCTVELPNHSWTEVSCNQSLPFFCHRDVYKSEFKRYSLVRVSFRSDLDLSDPGNYERLLQKLHENIKHPAVKMTSWKSPPQKSTKKKKDEANCP